MVIADYYYLTEGALLIIFAIRGQKIAGMSWELNPQPQISVLSQIPTSSQPKQLLYISEIS